jgi:hypothetical protein
MAFATLCRPLHTVSLLSSRSHPLILSAGVIRIYAVSASPAVRLRLSHGARKCSLCGPALASRLALGLDHICPPLPTPVSITEHLRMSSDGPGTCLATESAAPMSHFAQSSRRGRGIQAMLLHGLGAASEREADPAYGGPLWRSRN